jgi:hypothetical protein
MKSLWYRPGRDVDQGVNAGAEDVVDVSYVTTAVPGERASATLSTGVPCSGYSNQSLSLSSLVSSSAPTSAC